MSEIRDKKHWYDGKFYAKYFDPWAREIRETISGFIDSKNSVIDIGCGTGALVLQLAEKCNRVVGIELSVKMLQFANQQKGKGNFPRVKFIHADATRLSETLSETFDYATTSFVLHEMSIDERMKAINEMKAIAQKLIIADFIAPQPKDFWGIINTVSELLGGIDHFRNYWSFITQGGTERLLDRCGLKIHRKTKDRTGTYEIVRAIRR